MLKRNYNIFFRNLGTFKNPAYQSCLKINTKLKNLPIVSKELNYKLKIEHTLDNLVLLSDWRKQNQTEIDKIERKKVK